MTEPTAKERHRAEEERNMLVELADAIERAWVTKFGRIPVAAAWVINSMRKGW